MKYQKILKFDVLNLNDRMYTKDSIKAAVKDYNKRLKDLGVVYGELGYPDDFNTHALNVSHATGKLFIRKDILYCEIFPLSTRCGKILTSTLKDVVFRPRMIGNIDFETKICYVTEILSIDAIDKTIDSYLNNI